MSDATGDARLATAIEAALDMISTGRTSAAAGILLTALEDHRCTYGSAGRRRSRRELVRYGEQLRRVLSRGSGVWLKLVGDEPDAARNRVAER
jgi:hypothetical protein